MSGLWSTLEETSVNNAVGAYTRFARSVGHGA